MKNKPAPICGKHNKLKKWKATTFSYSEEGVSVRIPNIKAWVCPEDGEASFTPETVDDLIATVRELLESAKRTKTRRSMPTEYIVTVS